MIRPVAELMKGTSSNALDMAVQERADGFRARSRESGDQRDDAVADELDAWAEALKARFVDDIKKANSLAAKESAYNVAKTKAMSSPTAEIEYLRKLCEGMQVMLLEPVRQTIDAAETIIRADAAARNVSATGPERIGMERAISVMRAMLAVEVK